MQYYATICKWQIYIWPFIFKGFHVGAQKSRGRYENFFANYLLVIYRYRILKAREILIRVRLRSENSEID